MARFLFCGDRRWSESEAPGRRPGIRSASQSEIGPIRRTLLILQQYYPGSTIVHGDATGADRIAGRIALELGFSVDPHPVTQADWNRLGNAAGPIRNREMLQTGVSIVFAFHYDIQNSRGTKNMIIQAQRAGVYVQLFGSS